MTERQLIPREGETIADAQRRENIEAPYGRCGDHQELDAFPGCRIPLLNDGYYTCHDFPDCCRP